MNYIDMEKQLDTITGGLTQELEDEGAIDKRGNAVDIVKFNRILDRMIDKCNKILQQLEIERYDPNSNNLVQSRIQWLRTIRGIRTLNWHTGTNSDREEKIVIGSDYGSLRDVFKDGAKQVIRLFGFQKKPVSPEHTK